MFVPQFVAGAAALCVCALAARREIPQERPEVPSPDVCRGYAPSYLVVSHRLRAAVRLDAGKRTVELIWNFANDGDFSNGGDGSESQPISVDFTPTAAEAVASDKVVIAGWERDGTTRIELWIVSSPTIEPPVDVDAPYLFKVNPIATRTCIYRQRTVGRNAVRGLVRLLGTQRVLVHFQDSKDLYSLHWGAEPYACDLLYDHLAEAALKTKFDSYSSRDYAKHGHVYVFSNRDDLGTTPWLLLKDSDRDGTIDSHGVITPTDYIAQGLQDASQCLN